MFSLAENINKSLEIEGQWLLNVMRKNLGEVIISKHFKERMQERSISEDEIHELCDFGEITRIEPAELIRPNDLPKEFDLRLQNGAYELVAIVATDGRKFCFETCFRTELVYWQKW